VIEIDGIELREDLPARNPIAEVDAASEDLSSDAETELRFAPGDDLAR
jgi:hypothetical protein